MRKRIFFNKYSDMKFISHLDVVRLMDRLFKISNLELEYTQGFHPRPKISFGNPISLGEEAYNEPMDVVFVRDDLIEEEILNELNSSSPKGLDFINIENIEKKDNISVDFTVLKYKLEFENIDDYEKILSLLSQKEIIEIKEKKDGIKKRDLKLRVKNIEHTSNDEENIINLDLENMSPNSFIKLSGIEPSKVKVKRMGYEK